MREDPPPGQRLLGCVRGPRPGPTLVCIGALHGNEGAGVRALEIILEALRPRAEALAGEFVALVGNTRALARGRRYLERDLNRAWTEARLAELRRSGPQAWGPEDREQMELLEAIEAATSRARGAVYVLDLHTTSGAGGTFTTFGDTLPNRDFAAHIPVPMILGLEELVDGTLLAFLGHRGLVAVVFESGQHAEPEAVDRAVAGIWIAVGAAGLLPSAQLPEASEGWKRLHREARTLPRALEMKYRHPVAEEDAFVMEPGFSNFQPVEAGEMVARSAAGPIQVSESARVLMPLYQEQGEDGFFLVREFSPFWLWASSALRRLRVDRIAHWLPGVRRLPEGRDGVVVNKRVARWGAVQIFHLLGFRREVDRGHVLVMERRPYDDPRYVQEGPPTPALLEHDAAGDGSGPEPLHDSGSPEA